jgi:hypothetical protein
VTDRALLVQVLGEGFAREFAAAVGSEDPDGGAALDFGPSFVFFI